MKFTEMGTSPELIAILNQRGIQEPTEIQKLVFKPIVEGNSVLGLSKTGSGKTLAYLLPLVQNTKPTPVDNVGAAQNDAEKSRVLILCPTRELAHQIHTEMQMLMPERAGASLLIVGGDSEAEQLKGFASSLFLVATPGRLLDLIKNSALPLGSVHRVVLDEADRLLDMGFQEDIRDILGRIPKGFQLVCLSATLHLGVEELIYEMGVDFVRVNASSDADLTVEGLDHRVAFVGDVEKFHFLANFLKDRGEQRGIIFSNFRESAHRISKRLEGLGYRAEALSAQLSQPQRRKIMEDFRAEKLDILVASDVAARGLDVDALDFVVNFELPDDSATYVHRVGRTARAGKQGLAVSLVGFEDSFRLEKLESYLKLPIPRMNVDHSWLEGPLPRGKHTPPPAAARHHEPRSHQHRQQGEGGRSSHHHSSSHAPRTHQPREHHSHKPASSHTAHATPAKKPAVKVSWVKTVWTRVLSMLGVKPAAKVAPAAAPTRHTSSGGGGQHQQQRRSQPSGGRGGRGPRRDGGRRRPRPAGARRDGAR